MSDPTPGTPDQPEPDLPEPSSPAGGDETVRVPVEPEVAWNPPEPPRAMPWEAPAWASPPALPAAPAQPLTQPVDTAAAAEVRAGAPATPAGVLSAAPVGWVVPPPEPLATGSGGFVIASVGSRLGAWLLDGVITFSGIVLLAGAFGLVLAATEMGSDPLIESAIYTALLGFFYVYFVGFWTSKGKATPGMRAFKLQVANAADGKRLDIGSATIRWLALGYGFSLFAVIPLLSGLAGLAAFIWSIVLLATTSNNPMHQGLHDNWAGSVVVRLQGAGSGGGRGLTTCLILTLILGVLFAILMIGILVMTLARYG